MFNFGQSQQAGGLNLSATGAPNMTAGVQQGGVGFSLGAQQPQQPTGLVGGILQGAGVQQQYADARQFVQQPITPPSELEILSALLKSQNPVHRYIAGGGLGSLIDILATATSLSVLTILKDATFVIDDDEGAMKLDVGSLPDNLKTLSAENVAMLLNQTVNTSQQTVQRAEMERQQILTLAEQSMMGGALQAALADEGMMQKVGGGIGSVARGILNLPR
jgi:hypothetical protein|tara:strand:- start:386 stop:1045 length:660 start_codon:yes stop_codon:yes gene_type:complete